MFNRRAVLYGDVGFGRDGVLSLPKPSFLLSQKPSLGRIVDGLLPQKHAQLRAADFFALSPGFPGFRVRSEELLQRIDVRLENGRRFLLRAHAACK